MAKVNRLDLLAALQAVSPGLAKTEILEQSACFVFKDERVFTFNDEIFCSFESPINIEGAVQADKMLEMLDKLPDEELNYRLGEGVFQIMGKGRWTDFRMEAEVLLPIEAVELPKKWKPLDDEFGPAVNIAYQCAHNNEKEAYALTCIYLDPEFILASDNMQFMKYPLPTGIKEPILVKKNKLKHVANLGMTKIAETENWLHFKNPAGLILSCRCESADQYPDTSDILEGDGGTNVTLPNGLADAANRAWIASKENESDEIYLEIRSGQMRVRGAGTGCQHKEIKKVAYKGEKISMYIKPKLLIEIVNRHNECQLEPGKLRVTNGKFIFFTCTGAVEEKEDG